MVVLDTIGDTPLVELTRIVAPGSARLVAKLESANPTGSPLTADSHERVDAFVHSVSTAHSIHGTAQAIRQHNRRVRVVAVEPAESAVTVWQAFGVAQDRSY